MTDVGPVIVTPDGLAMLVSYCVLPHPGGGWGLVVFADGRLAVYQLDDLYATGVASEIEFRERSISQQLLRLGFDLDKE